MPETRVIQFRDALGPYRSRVQGVSLHSHTRRSEEPLDFLRRWFGNWAVLPWTWRPPLEPLQALRLERAQIEERLQLPALVSITDHDCISAPLELRASEEGRETPVSVEWTVPFRSTFLHLGLHNLPPRKAIERMKTLRAFTLGGTEDELAGVLDWITEDPSVLVVFNHPLWDEMGIGRRRHDSVAKEFLGRYRGWLHAMELNGLRRWEENARVLEWAGAWGLPAISGGDRHTLEPNAVLNLTRAATFGEFVAEVREDGISDVVVMPQYHRPLALRIAEGVGHVVWRVQSKCEMDAVVVPGPVRGMGAIERA
jgi:hypothetical protein